MKKAGLEVAQLLPAPGGWQLASGAGSDGRASATLAEAVAGQTPAGPLALSLPCQAVLMERLVLPSRERTELQGMVELQLEKTLPYPLEEVTWNFLHWPLVEEGAEVEQSSVLTLAVHTPVLEQLAEPLRTAGRMPQKISCYAEQLATQAPGEGPVLLLWQEQEQTVMALAERQRLSWAQTLPTVAPEEVVAELPGLLLGAEMQGVDARYTQVLLAPECGALAPALAEDGTVRFGEWPKPETLVAQGVNLLPAGWKEESGRQGRQDKLRSRLLIAAMGYLTLLAAGFVFLAWRKQGLQKLTGEITRTRPLIEATQVRQARWEALAPAIEPGRSAVGILFLVNRARPQDDVRITVFDFSPAQFTVEGEAPSTTLAIEFAERLRKEAELSTFAIEAGPPQILPNEHAQFRIAGRLQ